MSGRSYLFVPGNRSDCFEKARNAGADAVILDLENWELGDDKAEAREAFAAWLSPARPAYVRVNDPAGAPVRRLSASVPMNLREAFQSTVTPVLEESGRYAST